MSVRTGTGRSSRPGRARSAAPPWIHSSTLTHRSSPAQHLQERPDAGLELLGILVRVVGLDAQYGDPRVLQGPFHEISLGVVDVAELQVDVDDAVRAVFAGQAQDVVDKAVYWVPLSAL